MELRRYTWVSPFGPMQLAWTWQEATPRVQWIRLPGRWAESGAEHPTETCPAIEELVEQLQRCMQGEPVAFSTELLAWERCAPFQRRVLEADYAIARGRVSSYGRIAAYLGVPGGARAVGNALARNPFPIVVPCHRALRSDGSLGGFQGGLAMKRALLEHEGVRFQADGRVWLGPDGGEDYYSPGA